MLPLPPLPVIPLVGVGLGVARGVFVPLLPPIVRVRVDWKGARFSSDETGRVWEERIEEPKVLDEYEEPVGPDTPTEGGRDGREGWASWKGFSATFDGC